MTKTTFLGYVPSLKSKHEATIVNGRAMKSKGGSIRYLLEGEYDGRKTLPKTVSKADFESVYGFDAKEAESVLVVGEVDGPFGKQLEVAGHVKGVTDKKGFTPTNIQSYDRPILEGSVMDEGLKSNLVNHADTVGSPSPADVEPSAPSEKPFPQEPSNENFSAETEVKEALGLFGKKEEEEKEESDEPKTQEFTVVLQEGDKLELTDIEEEENEEEQAAPDDENTEKEAETLEITDIDWETDDEDVDLPASVLVPSSVVEDEIADYLSDEYGFLVRGYVLNAESEVKATDCDDHFYEAVQAKVTRPVKEDETEDEEESDEEGLSTGAKVALGVGALAAGVALFGAEDDPYENQTDYSRIYEATSGDGYINHDRIDTEEQRMVELRYDDPTTYYNWNSPYDVDESEVEDAIESELGDEPSEGSYDTTVEVRGSKYGEQGQKYVDVDVDMDTDYGDSRTMGLAAEDIEDSDYDDYLDELEGDALILYKDNPSHLFEKAYPIDYQVGMNDYESSLLADIQSGYTENSMLFDEDENLTPYGEKVLKEMYDSLIDEALGIEWLASKHPPSELLKRGDPMAYRVGLSEYQDAFESESDGYTYAYTKGHEDGMSNDVIYRPSIPTDREKNIYKKILKQKAESFEAEKMGWDIKEYGNKDKYASKDGVEVIIAPIRKSSYQYHPRDAKWKLTYGRETPHGVVPLAKLFGTYEDVFRWLNNPPFEVKSFGADTNFSAEGDGLKAFSKKIENEKKKLIKKAKRSGFYENFGDKETRKLADSIPRNLDFSEERKYDDLVREFSMWAMNLDLRDLEYQSETVGSPSPSGPSSTPEPAEATGSEPSNEEFKGENRNLAIGLTAAGVGLVALLGADRIKKLFDRFNL